MEITKQEYLTWKQHKVTKEVFSVLEFRKNSIAHKLGEGGAIIVPDNAILVGRYRELIDLICMVYEDMFNPDLTTVTE